PDNGHHVALVGLVVAKLAEHLGIVPAVQRIGNSAAIVVPAGDLRERPHRFRSPLWVDWILRRHGSTDSADAVNIPPGHPCRLAWAGTRIQGRNTGRNPSIIEAHPKNPIWAQSAETIWCTNNPVQ